MTREIAADLRFRAQEIERGNTYGDTPMALQRAANAIEKLTAQIEASRMEQDAMALVNKAK